MVAVVRDSCTLNTLSVHSLPQQAELIADTAVRTVLTPVAERDFNICIRLNEPVEDPSL